MLVQAIDSRYTFIVDAIDCTGGRCADERVHTCSNRFGYVIYTQYCDSDSFVGYVVKIDNLLHMGRY